MKRVIVAAVAAVIAIPVVATAEIVPQAVPDLPLLGAQAYQGNDLLTWPAAPQLPTPKVVDGSIGDWIGEISRIGGTALLSRGEYVYQDFIMDDWGADDGFDEQRAAVLDPLAETEPRTYRAEALVQAAGEQFGADKPIGAPSEYGDADPPAALADHADIEEVRFAADLTRLFGLVRTTGMVIHGGTAVVVFVDDPATDAVYGGLTVPQTAADHEFVIIGDAFTVHRSGSTVTICPCAGLVARSNPAGFINAVEFAIPLALLGGGSELRVGVATGVAEDGAIASVSPAGAATELINVAFRFDEPARIWMDHDQALALRSGDLDRYLTPIDLNQLRAGVTQDWDLRAGYYERVYETDSPVNREVSSNSYWQGSFQHYGLYIPTSYSPGRKLPTTWWTHYRGGHAHDAAAWVPGLIRQLGEARGNIMIMPGARGTSTWYVGQGHEDFLDVWDDSMASFPIDEDRVYMSGYSMGGFASWLLPLVYPDRFAGSFPTAGPPTQGLWDGIGLVAEGTNDGRAADQLTFDIIGNAANIGYVIYHGSNDELVPVTGPTRMASELTRLGYDNRLYIFPGAEHYTNAILDEWTEAAAYLDRFVRDPNPARVHYALKPAMIRAIEELRTPVTLDYSSIDGAYWVDGMVVRDPEDAASIGTVDATTYGRGVEERIGIPEAGTGGQLVPHVMTGLRSERIGFIEPTNRFTATLTGLVEARLDIVGMALSTTSPITATITTDGPTTLRLQGAWPGTTSVTGATMTHVPGLLSLDLDAAGTYEVTISPA